MPDFLPQALRSTILIIAPAVITFTVTILALHLMERIARQRERRRATELMAGVRHVRRRFRREQAAALTQSQNADSQVRPLEVRVRFRRHEWQSAPVNTLDPKADWN